MAVRIRESKISDIPALEALYPLAFPEEDLLPLLHSLLTGGFEIVSLVAEADDRIVGHALFTIARISCTDAKVALLGPVAVAPDRQKQGIGSVLIETGCERLASKAVSHVFVLGDPAYYGRFGFVPDYKVMTPYKIPEEWREAWQSKALSGGKPDLAGTLVLPDPWNAPELWAAPE